MVLVIKIINILLAVQLIHISMHVFIYMGKANFVLLLQCIGYNIIICLIVSNLSLGQFKEHLRHQKIRKHITISQLKEEFGARYINRNSNDNSNDNSKTFTAGTVPVTPRSQTHLTMSSDDRIVLGVIRKRSVVKSGRGSISYTCTIEDIDDTNNQIDVIYDERIKTTDRDGDINIKEGDVVTFTGTPKKNKDGKLSLYCYSYEIQQQNAVYTLSVFLLYITLYAIGLITTIFYFICDALPVNNRMKFFRDHEMRIALLTRGCSFVLAISSSIVVPRLIDSLSYMCNCLGKPKRRTWLILGLRTFNSIILPVISSFVFLDDCLAGWRRLWSDCGPKNNNLNVGLNLYDEIYSYDDKRILHVPININIIDKKDVCDFKMNNWDQCIRSFMYNWSDVITWKLIWTIFIPFLVVLEKKIKQYIVKKCNCLKRFIDTKIKIESEYCMLISKIEIIIAYSFQTPLILPIGIISIYLNKLCYGFILNKLKWELKSYFNMHISFPVIFLSVGIILGQISNVGFFIACVKEKAVSYCLLSFLLIDVFFLKQYKKKQKNIENESSSSLNINVNN